MTQLIKTGQTIAARRLVRFAIIDEDGSPFAGSVSGVTADLYINGNATPNTIGGTAVGPLPVVRINALVFGCTLTPEQLALLPVGTIVDGEVVAGVGRRHAPFSFAVTSFDPLDAPDLDDIAGGTSTQLLADMAGSPGAAVRTAFGQAAETALADNVAAVGTAVAAVPGAVDTAVADNFSAVLTAIAGIATGTPPSAATVSAQVMSDLAGAGGANARGAVADRVRDELYGVRVGSLVVPSGGSSVDLSIVDAASNATLGTLTVVRDADGDVTGVSEVVP